MKFLDMKQAVQKQFSTMVNGELFYVDVDKDALWDTYLASFPEGTNPIYKERTEFDCTCCKQFIRNGGNAVSIVDGKLVSIWDVDLGGDWQVVADALSSMVKSHAIKSVFRHDTKHLGTDNNHQQTEAGVIKWEHFYYQLPAKYVITNGSIATYRSKVNTNKELLERSLEEISLEASNIVLELIAQNSLYRGEEHKPTVVSLLKVKKAYDKLNTDLEKQLFLWKESVRLEGVSRFKNTVIGTLLADITAGVALEDAVKMFESKVAPENYKRSSALITGGMIKKAEEKVAELGIEDSLHRRYAVADDITINNVLFADRSVKKALGVFGELYGETKDKQPNLDKVEDISISDFINNILPKATNLEMMVDNKHTSNFLSLIAPTYEDSKGIFKWDNNFSWSYNGEVADSMKERVKSLGGRVDGVLRFTHSWNHNGDNQSLMDLHVFMPNSGYEGYKQKVNSGGKEKHDAYPSGRRVGWNHRNDPTSGGVQDVDFTSPPHKEVPLENITFPNTKSMPEGKYLLKVHNWSARQPNRSGFKAEVEFNGELHQYEYADSMENKEWITVAEVTLKNDKFSIAHKLPSTTTSKEVWGVSTQKWKKVSMVMNSPNHWDGNETGNKHWFFMLEGCNNPEKTRGFFNEYLNNNLTEHRKVFEVLSSKMKTGEADNQLSGLGFSSTQRNSVLCKVTGSFNRTINIKF